MASLDGLPFSVLSFSDSLSFLRSFPAEIACKTALMEVQRYLLAGIKNSFGILSWYFMVAAALNGMYET